MSATRHQQNTLPMKLIKRFDQLTEDDINDMTRQRLRVYCALVGIHVKQSRDQLAVALLKKRTRMENGELPWPNLPDVYAMRSPDGYKQHFVRECPRCSKHVSAFPADFFNHAQECDPEFFDSDVRTWQTKTKKKEEKRELRDTKGLVTLDIHRDGISGQPPPPEDQDIEPITVLKPLSALGALERFSRNTRLVAELFLPNPNVLAVSVEEGGEERVGNKENRGDGRRVLDIPDFAVMQRCEEESPQPSTTDTTTTTLATSTVDNDKVAVTGKEGDVQATQPVASPIKEGDKMDVSSPTPALAPANVSPVTTTTTTTTTTATTTATTTTTSAEASTQGKAIPDIVDEYEYHGPQYSVKDFAVAEEKQFVHAFQSLIQGNPSTLPPPGEHSISSKGYVHYPCPADIPSTPATLKRVLTQCLENLGDKAGSGDGSTRPTGPLRTASVERERQQSIEFFRALKKARKSKSMGELHEVLKHEATLFRTLKPLATQPRPDSTLRRRAEGKKGPSSSIQPRKENVDSHRRRRHSSSSSSSDDGDDERSDEGTGQVGRIHPYQQHCWRHVGTAQLVRVVGSKQPMNEQPISTQTSMLQ